jgi:hypothetical protein
MSSLVSQVISWPVLGTALAVFGFAPGAVLRVIVLAFRRDDPRRRELLGELHAVPRIERPFWVAEQLEVALFEGLRSRFARKTAHDPLRVQELEEVREILVQSMTERLIERGISLQQIRSAVSHIHEGGQAEDSLLVLISDGVSVCKCTSADEFRDLMDGGQGTYGIQFGQLEWIMAERSADLPLPP